VRERAALQEQERLQIVAKSNAEKAMASAAQAQTGAEKSREVSLFMKDMIERVGPAAMASESGTWRQIVDGAASQIGTGRLDPGVEWELRTTLGSVYYSLGQKQRAVEMQREALQLARLHPEASSGRIIESLVNLGWVLNQNGQPTLADPLFREAFALAKVHFQNDNPRMAWIKGRLGWNLMDEGKLDEAEPLCREALEKARAHWKTAGASDTTMPGNLAGYATGLAYVMALRGQNVEAEQLFREAVSASKERKGGSDLDTSGWIKNLATFLRGIGRRDEAEALYREAWDLDKIQAPKHPRQVGAAGNLALILRERGENLEANKILAELMADARSLPEADRPSWANNLSSVGVSAASLGYWNDASTLLQTARQLGADAERLPVHRMAVAWQTKDKAAVQKAFDDFIAGLSKRNGGAMGIDVCTVLALMPASDLRFWIAHLSDAARNSAGAPEWRLAATALAALRAGELKAALESARQAASQTEPGPRVTGQLVLALGQHSAGKDDEARQSVAAARAGFAQFADAKTEVPGKRLLDWVIIRALLDETTTAIGI
jgi:tetratricopeptide (TPR) repeat protein